MEAIHLQTPEGASRISLIPALGACLYSWRVSGPSGQPVELIWPGDRDEAMRLREQGILSGFPFLFPLANRVFVDGKEGAYTWAGKRYEMTIHGFSNASAWDVASVHEKADVPRVEIVLTDSAETRKRYPWSFRAELTYSLRATELTIDQTIQNRSDDTMPLSPGWHPYFRVPLTNKGSKAECVLRLPGRTELGINLSTAQMSGESKPFARPRMTLAEHGATGKYVTDLSEPRVSIFDPAAAMGVEMDLRGPDGSLAWPFILTWTLSNEAPFFCVEPYEGVTNAVHSGVGLRLLGPGASYASRLTARAVFQE